MAVRLVSPPPLLRPTGAARLGIALCLALAGCYQSHGWPERSADDDALSPDAEDDTHVDLATADADGAPRDGAHDGVVPDDVEPADIDPYAIPYDCEPVFPSGSMLCREGLYCPDDWSLCCSTNLCGPPGGRVRGCCNDPSCGHAILPFALFSCIGAAHDDYLRVADCSECPVGYAYCCDHFRTPLFCTNERPHAWFCRELAE